MGVSLHKPETIEEAVRLKSEDSEALFLAGGQTLIAMMNAELVEPPALISLDRISDLKGIDRQPAGRCRTISGWRGTAAGPVFELAGGGTLSPGDVAELRGTSNLK